MKKIMKKALSLALALVMVLAMTPMTAKAATTLTGTDTVTIAAGGMETFTYQASGVTELSTYAVNVSATVDGEICYDFQVGMWGYPERDGNYSAQLPSDDSGILTFNVMNTGEVDAVFTITTELYVEPVGSENNPDTELTLDTVTEVEGIANNWNEYSYYYEWTATKTGKLSIELDEETIESSGGYWILDIVSANVSKWGMDGDDPIAEADVSTGDVVRFYIINPMWSHIGFTASVEETVTPGSSAGTAVETTAGNSYTNTCNMTYYTYTAAADGVLTLTTTGATYSGFNTVNGDSPSLDDYTSADGVLKMQLKKGDEVVYWLSGTAGSTKVAVSYENGATLQKNEEEVNYEMSETALALGTNKYTLSNTYPYTVFEFVAPEDGRYTITAHDTAVDANGVIVPYASKLGLASYNGVWVTTEPSADTVNANVIIWEMSEGASIWVAVASDANVATIDVAKTGSGSSSVTPTIYAGIEATPAAYKYAGDESALTRVAFADDTEDVVYLGSDGYYHLNAINGPIVLVDLADDAIINLFDAANLGRLNGVKEISGTTYKWDFNSLVMYYTSCTEAGYVLNTENLEYKIGNGSTLYPLTVQLMQMLQEVGNNPSNNWYGEGGYIANTEDAWMFCCYYDKNYTTDTPIVNVADIPATPAEDILADAGVKFEEGKVVIDKEALAILVEANKSQPIQITATTAKGDIVFRFEANTMSDAGLEKYSFAASVTTNYDGIKDTVVSKDSIALRIDFAHSGKLPGTAKVTIPVDKAYAGKTLYYYLINEDGTLTYTGSCGVVNAKGEVTVSQNHCSSYVLSTQAPAQDAANPKTGDDMNLGLWAAILMLGLAGVTVVMRKKSF